MMQLATLCRNAALLVALFFACAPPASAEDGPLTVVLRPNQSAADIQAVLDLAAKTGRPISIEYAQPQGSALPPAPATASGPTSAETSAPGSAPAPAPAQTQAPVQAQTQAAAASAAASMPAGPTPEMLATDMGMATMETFSTAFLRGASAALKGLSGMSSIGAMAAEGLRAEGSGFGRAFAVTAATLAIAAVAALLVRQLARQVLYRSHRPAPRVAGKVGRRIRSFLGDLCCVALFVAIARLVGGMFERPDSVTFYIVRSAVLAAVVSMLYIAIARLLFWPDADGRAMTAIRRPTWHFRMLVAYGVIGAVLTETARLADTLGFDRNTIDGWFPIGNTVLTLIKLVWFIGGRHDISHAFIGARPGLVRRIVGNLLPDFYVATALGLWLLSVLVAGTPDNGRWIFAAATTQVILLVLPILALGAHAIVDEVAHHHEAHHGPGLASAILSSLRVVCAGGVWIGGLHLITTIWWPLMGGEATIAASWILWLERLSLAIAACWAVCTLIWRYSEAVAPSPRIALPGQEDEQNEKHQTSRLSTALPVVRNLALGAALAVGALLVLSSLGVNVAPLLAGFGVLGLALSFGSQALVKDVVSGIFFIADDAFRIGEYISTGSLQGTVEQITVRSIRLRHHNGPIHTVPFGQINSVTNYSRDWGTIKFQLRFERDSDAELIRKTAKKVGLAMLADPEIGPEFLIPLKMQGIQDITETALVIRFKFTCLPGNPSILKREAMNRLIAAYKAAGLEFASNAVTVRSRSKPGADADAAEIAAAASLPPPLPSVAV